MGPGVRMLSYVILLTFLFQNYYDSSRERTVSYFLCLPKPARASHLTLQMWNILVVFLVTLFPGSPEPIAHVPFLGMPFSGSPGLEVWPSCLFQ